MAANLSVLAVLIGLAFRQRPGDTTFDTKFDLTADPGAFMTRSLHLWNPTLSFGELQNQAYGYLFPQGLFAYLAERAGVADWVAQRLWMALVLVVAYEGARRLFRALRPDVPWPWAILAGVAFALSPRLLGLAGVLTAEVLPTAVLPWVVLPLVHALGGRCSPRLAGLLSGCAVLFMGGVNAVENLAALPLPALLVACALGSAGGRRLAGWWVLAVSLACAWWMLPLLVLGRYSPPFLDYIETAAATTFPLGWVNVVRGADHWVAFVSVGGRPWWPGAYELAWDGWLIAATGAVAAVSLAGLLHPRMPLRVPLALSVLLGLGLLAVGHVTLLGSPLAESVRHLLDGPLAPLRNVHKVDPLVRLPMAMGFAHAGVVLARWGRARVPSTTPRRALAWAGAPLAVLLVVSAQPALAGELRKEGWQEVPEYWSQAAHWLETNADGRRVLVVPGSGFGQQTWGWTIDEPIQGLSRSPWVARSQVPLVPGPTIRYLDGLEERIQDGRGSPALADALARAGIGFVLVRRDLDLAASGVANPPRVDQAIARSPGLQRVAAFGRTGFGNQAAVVIHRVERDVPLVEAVRRDDVATLAGEPADVVTALESGLLDGDQPVVVGTASELGREPDLVGDGYRRRERQFGRLVDSLSQTMAGSEPYRTERPAHDYPGVAGVPRAEASYRGVESVTASSSSGYADTLGAVRPELGPFAAVDGLADTYWRSAPLENPVGQWVRVRLGAPRPLPYVDIEVGVDSFSGLPVRRVEVDTGVEQVEREVDPETGRLRVPLRGDPVEQVTVTVTDVEGAPSTGVVAIREVRPPGVEVGRTIEVPDVGATGSTSFLFRAAPGRRACVRTGYGPSCDPDQERPGEEESGLYRSFTVDGVGDFAARGTVVARPTSETAALLSPLPGGLRVQASSVLSDDPAVSGQFAFDRRSIRPWIAQPGDREPSLLLTWDEPRRISRIRLRASLTPSRLPPLAVLEGAFGQRREVPLGPNGPGFFEPMVTDRLVVRFPVAESPEGFASVPVGVGEIDITGIQDLKYRPDPASPTGAECGLGPAVVIDRVSHPTRITGTLDDVIFGRPMTWESCGDSIALGAGRHELSVDSDSRFAPATLTLDSQEPGVENRFSVTTRAVEVVRWTSTDRTVRVAPGEESVLRVPENRNDGWRATLDGEELERITVDGWQQGWVIPAGSGGEVRLEFTPDGPYRAALVTGSASAAVLLLGALAALVLDRRRPGSPPPLPLLGSRPRRATVRRRWVLAVAAAGWLLGGVGVAAGCVLGAVVRPATGRVVASVLVATSAVGVGVVGLSSVELVDGFDVVAAVAVGMLASGLVGWRSQR